MAKESSSESNAAREPNNVLAPFNPTCDHAQQVALKMLNLNENDVLFDLGCGDARFLSTAVSQISGLRCVGIEIDRTFVDKAIKAIKHLPIEQQQRIDIRLQDVLKSGADATEKLSNSEDSTIGSSCRNLTLQDATALFLYLLPKGLVRIKNAILDKIVEERRGNLRIVTYMFQIHGWTPAKIDRSTKGGAPVFLYEFSTR